MTAPREQGLVSGLRPCIPCLRHTRAPLYKFVGCYFLQEGIVSQRPRGVMELAAGFDSCPSFEAVDNPSPEHAHCIRPPRTTDLLWLRSPLYFEKRSHCSLQSSIFPKHPGRDTARFLSQPIEVLRNFMTQESDGFRFSGRIWFVKQIGSLRGPLA